MSRPIEDYALVSDCHTGALIGRDGSVDWLCLPRYDSPSTFGALLGEPDHGRWLVAPTDPDATASRHYLDRTFVLVTTWTTATGVLEVTDYMPQGDGRADLVRRLRCTSGEVEVQEDLRIRFGYASVVPWVRQVSEDGGTVLIAVAGPDAIVRRGCPLKPDGNSHTATYRLRSGESMHLSLTWYESHLPDPGPVDQELALGKTVEWWREWASRYSHEGPYYDAVIRSLLVLRALTHEATGGIVAAATTSLPEQFGGPRNWDYRFVWLRDASLTLSAFLTHSYVSEAQAWRNWLLRAVAGDPADVQIMYGLAGERYLPERKIDSLPGYQGSAPVRVGNAAYRQFQGDVIGEVMVALAEARDAGVDEDAFSWPLQRALVSFVEDHWHREDQGIWEVRGPRRAFTHSRVMMWAALDRAVRGGSRARSGRAGGPLGGTARPDPCRHRGARLRRGAQHVRPVVRVHGGGRVPAAAATSRLLRPRRSPDAGDGGRHRTGPDVPRAGDALPLRPGDDRRTAAGRAPLPRLLVLAGRAVRPLGTAG